MLRARCIVLLVVALLLAPRVSLADEVSDIALLEKLNAYFRQDHKTPGNPVIEVSLKGANITDAVLLQLTSLKQLVTVHTP